MHLSPSNKNITPENFFSRLDKLKLKKIPETDFSKVIIMPNLNALGFKKNCYSDFYLHDKIDKDTFDKTVEKTNKIVENILNKKRYIENHDPFYYLNYFFYISFLCLFISIIYLIVFVYEEERNNKNLENCFICLFISIFFTVIGTIFNLKIKPKHFNLENEMKIEINDFLKKENALFYQKNNLLWEVQENCYWLELQIL